jgi:hypothetical protein
MVVISSQASYEALTDPICHRRSILPGQLRTLDLPFQHDQLLPQQRVFQHQFPLAACQVQRCVQHQPMVAWLRPSS